MSLLKLFCNVDDFWKAFQTALASSRAGTGWGAARAESHGCPPAKS